MERYIMGEASAFEALYDRYHQRMMSFFARRLPASSRSIQSDLFQITWLKVHQARSKFDLSKKFSTWIYTIALNTLRDYGREKYKSLGVAWSDEHEFSSAQPPTALTDQELKDLEKMLKNLPEDWREILILSDWEGFTSKEVSAIKGLGEENIRQILSRARRSLRGRNV